MHNFRCYTANLVKIGRLVEKCYSTRNVIFYKINDRIGLTHDTIEYTHDRTRFTHDTIGLIYDRIKVSPDKR